ncbi:MAG: PQQ-dependent sugar dehydrogenase [Chloroflexi bacterium]|nr:PQQ-dependent sugar dehydrogenase [Chloroflexota bacterium]
MPVFAVLIRRRFSIAVSLIIVSAVAISGKAQRPDLPECTDRPTAVSAELYVDNIRWCVEGIVHDPALEPLSFTALEAAPDGRLFAARPLTGEVMVIRDTDGDTLPDSMDSFAEGLSRPNGLAYRDGVLYVAGGARIYRISEAGEVTTLVDDLPTGSGFPAGGITVGADNRLYLAMGAPCSFCEFDEPERGVILSMTLDGDDRQVVATGFRNPADLAFFRGQLWTLDSAPPQRQRNALDELNHVQKGGWYGFPHCLGKETGGIASQSLTCSESIAPVIQFGSGAIPSSLAAYPHDILPGTKDTLIVVLKGDPSQIDIVGYKVIMITFDEVNQPLGATVLIPYRLQFGRPAYVPYRGEGLFWEEFIHINELGFGFYPQQPLAVTVSPQGWIYISLTGGRIIALRPRYDQTDYERFYPTWTPMHPNFDPSALPQAATQ